MERAGGEHKEKMLRWIGQTKKIEDGGAISNKEAGILFQFPLKVKSKTMDWNHLQSIHVQAYGKVFLTFWKKLVQV